VFFLLNLQNQYAFIWAIRCTTTGLNGFPRAAYPALSEFSVAVTRHWTLLWRESYLRDLFENQTTDL